jgi:mono/diheme cytochrome c family protein
MKRIIDVIAAVGAAFFAASASAGNADRGELLYNARCVGCHTESVHNRAARKALTIVGIKSQVKRWNAFLEGAWGEREINDVTTYLNDLYYHYPCTPEVCPDDKQALRERDVRPAGLFAKEGAKRSVAGGP